MRRLFGLQPPKNATAGSHLFALPRAPSSIVPGISAGADAIVLRSLRKDPARRYATMDILDLAVGRAMSGLPVDPGDAEGDAYTPVSPFGEATMKRLEARKLRNHLV